MRVTFTTLVPADYTPQNVADDLLQRAIKSAFIVAGSLTVAPADTPHPGQLQGLTLVSNDDRDHRLAVDDHGEQGALHVPVHAPRRCASGTNHQQRLN